MLADQVNWKGDRPSGAKSCPTLLAFGGGKGGTGKSFFSLQVAKELARRGLRTVLIDLDTSAGSLHHFIPLKETSDSHPELCDFLVANEQDDDQRQSTQGRGRDLDSSLVKCIRATALPHLYFVPGRKNSSLAISASIKAHRKIALLEQVRKINADYVIFDLGSGTHVDTLDFAIFSDFVLVPIGAEEIVIENVQVFLKGIFSRKVETAIAATQDQNLAHWWKNVSSSVLSSQRSMLSQLQSTIADTFPGKHQFMHQISQEIRNLKVGFVLNQARLESDLLQGSSFAKYVSSEFGFSSSYHGFLRYDDSVWNQVRRSRIASSDSLSSAAHRDIQRFLHSYIDHIAMHEARFEGRRSEL